MSDRMTQFDRATLTTEDPEFTAWVRAQPAEWWAKLDLSACRLGFAVMKQQRDEIKGQTLAALNEWACRYEPEMFEFLGLPDAAVAKFAYGMIEKIRADILEAWGPDSHNAAPDRTSDQARSVEGMVGKLVEMGNFKDGLGDEVVGVLIECSKDDLHSCDLQMYGDVRISNATRTDSFGAGDGCREGGSE
jgi:hypothetical protein